MAIVNIKSGRYIKVIRELSVFRPNSILVFYYSFRSRKDKEDFFAREKAVSKFVQTANDFLAHKYALLNADIEAYAVANGRVELKFDNLPKKFRVQFDELSRIESSIALVKNEWDEVNPLPTLDFIDTLIELGFDRAWLVPLPPHELSSVHTGAFTNQTFTYECLYRELKKIFKDDFIDC